MYVVCGRRDTRGFRLETRPVQCRAAAAELGLQLTAGSAGASYGAEDSSDTEEVVVEEEGVGDDGEAEAEARASAVASASFSKAAAAGENHAAYGQGAGTGAGRWDQVVSRLAQLLAMGGRGSCFASWIGFEWD